jgi:hypothetical protein
MHIEVKHGSGITPYYTTIINSTVNACKFVNGSDSNPIANWISGAVTDSLPKGFIHPCPYVGLMKIDNISISANGVLSQFLKGRYKISARVFDEEDDNIITFKLGTEL